MFEKKEGLPVIPKERALAAVSGIASAEGAEVTYVELTSYAPAMAKVEQPLGMNFAEDLDVYLIIVKGEQLTIPRFRGVTVDHLFVLVDAVDGTVFRMGGFSAGVADFNKLMELEGDWL